MLMIEKLFGKLNEVTVTHSTMEYGSITIDENLMDLAGFQEHDAVEVNGSTTGARIRTYVLKGKRGSGIVGVRGGASLHFSEGDRVHVLKYCYVDNLSAHTPKVVYTDNNNQPIYDEGDK